MTFTFVYVSGLKGPEPQLWDDDIKSSMKPLQSHKLPKEQQSMPLDELVKLYPFKAEQS